MINCWILTWFCFFKQTSFSCIFHFFVWLWYLIPRVYSPAQYNMYCDNISEYWANTWKMCSPASAIFASIVTILVSFEVILKRFSVRISLKSQFQSYDLPQALKNIKLASKLTSTHVKGRFAAQTQGATALLMLLRSGLTSAHLLCK